MAKPKTFKNKQKKITQTEKGLKDISKEISDNI